MVGVKTRERHRADKFAETTTPWHEHGARITPPHVAEEGRGRGRGGIGGKTHATVKGTDSKNVLHHSSSSSLFISTGDPKLNRAILVETREEFLTTTRRRPPLVVRVFLCQQRLLLPVILFLCFLRRQMWAPPPPAPNLPSQGRKQRMSGVPAVSLAPAHRLRWRHMKCSVSWLGGGMPSTRHFSRSTLSM